MTEFTFLRVQRITGRIAPIQNTPIRFQYSPEENGNYDIQGEIQYRMHYRVERLNRRSLIGILGIEGSGRNTLAFRISKLAENRPFDENEVERATRHSVMLDIFTRRHRDNLGVVQLGMRIVPPDVDEEDVAFFSPHGEITRCNALIFCIDITEIDSSMSVQQLLTIARRCCRNMPPFLFVGNKVDQRYFLAPFRPEVGRRMARDEGARGYVECSALQNIQMSRVYNKVIRMIVPT